MATQVTGTNFPSGILPRPEQTVSGDNYLNLSEMNFGIHELPEVLEKEVERFGKRTVTGFLRMVGAEMPMASDRVIWAEQGRLHISFTDVTIQTAAGGDTINSIAHNGGLLRFADQTARDFFTTGMTIIISKGSNELKCRVMGRHSSTVTDLVVEPYTATDLTSVGADGTTNCSVFVFGSEFAKGSGESGNSIEAKVNTFNNKPIILRDKYVIDGSDVAQIGWVEVSSENGAGGYLWYLKSEHEARMRFEDQLEMAMIESETASNAGITGAGVELGGSEGLFAAIEDRGIVFTGTDFDGAGGLTTDFDDILKELDKQGSIEENMMFLNRAKSLEIDNMLATQNSYGVGGTSYGVFENDEDIALNLGFSGFRRGSYDFYKSDWKYLNDSTTRGLNDIIQGVFIPAGTSSVYDELLGRNVTRPFLHVRYRATATEDRRMKSWVTGSVGGNFTSAEDQMKVHFLSERALVCQAANNFVLLKA